MRWTVEQIARDLCRVGLHLDHAATSWAKRCNCCITFRSVLQRADVLLAAPQVRGKLSRLLHHRLVAEVDCGWEAAVERDVPFLARLQPLHILTSAQAAVCMKGASHSDTRWLSKDKHSGGQVRASCGSQTSRTTCMWGSCT